MARGEITIGMGLEIGLQGGGFIGALQGSWWYQDLRGMLKGTQAGTRISLSVRQKHPLHGRSIGGIGDLMVDAVWHWGTGLRDVAGFTFDLRSPISSVPE